MIAPSVTYRICMPSRPFFSPQAKHKGNNNSTAHTYRHRPLERLHDRRALCRAQGVCFECMCMCMCMSAFQEVRRRSFSPSSPSSVHTHVYAPRQQLMTRPTYAQRALGSMPPTTVAPRATSASRGPSTWQNTSTSVVPAAGSACMCVWMDHGGRKRALWVGLWCRAVPF